jgi:hypothetical protein
MKSLQTIRWSRTMDAKCWQYLCSLCPFWARWAKKNLPLLQLSLFWKITLKCYNCSCCISHKPLLRGHLSWKTIYKFTKGMVSNEHILLYHAVILKVLFRKSICIICQGNDILLFWTCFVATLNNIYASLTWEINLCLSDRIKWKM